MCSNHLNLIKSLEQDAQRICYYFVLVNERDPTGTTKLPEELHNFMVMDAANGNAFAKCYLNSYNALLVREINQRNFLCLEKI